MTESSVVSREQLVHLLTMGHETEQLDYKQECDLNNLHTLVEFAKDVAAFQIAGGYIVVGADDHGTPVPPGVLPHHEKLFDEATIRQKIARWVPEPFELRTALHTIDTCRFAIINIAQRRDGFCIMKSDGKYPSPDPKARQRDKWVFREGDVLARHGTSSERWRQDDAVRIFDAAVEQRREEWRRQFRYDLDGAGIAQAAQRLIAGPVTNFTWQLDAAAFDAATLELLRRDDDIPLRHMLDAATAAADALIAAGAWDELATLVGRITSVAAQAITYRRPVWVEEAVRRLTSIYRLGFDHRGYQRNDRQAEDVWLLVIEHLFALGALAARKEDWSAIKSIAVRHPGTEGDYWTVWIRHGLVMASRADKLLTDDRRSTKSVLTLALERIIALPALQPDVAPAAEELLTSMCQFDILATLAVIAETGDLDTRGWYTSYARFYASRTEPAVVRLLADDEMRKILFPAPDQFLADSLKEINRMASGESGFNRWFDFESAAVRKFIEDNSSSST